MNTKPRIGCGVEHDRAQIFNGNYSPSGKLIGDLERPWTVLGPDVFRMCETHAEALQWALNNALKSPESSGKTIE